MTQFQVHLSQFWRKILDACVDVLAVAKTLLKFQTYGKLHFKMLHIVMSGALLHITNV